MDGWSVLLTERRLEDLQVLTRDGKILILLPRGMHYNGSGGWVGPYMNRNMKVEESMVERYDAVIWSKAPHSMQVDRADDFRKSVGTVPYISAVYISPGRGIWQGWEVTGVKPYEIVENTSTFGFDGGIVGPGADIIDRAEYYKKRTIAPGRKTWVRSTEDFTRSHIRDRGTHALHVPHDSMPILHGAIIMAIQAFTEECYPDLSCALRAYLDTSYKRILGKVKDEECKMYGEALDPRHHALGSSLHVVTTKKDDGPFVIHDMVTILTKPHMRKIMKADTVQAWLRQGFNVPMTKGSIQALTRIALDPLVSIASTMTSPTTNSWSNRWTVRLEWDVFNWKHIIQGLPPEWGEEIFKYMISENNLRSPSKDRALYIRKAIDTFGYKKIINASKRMVDKNLDRSLALEEVTSYPRDKVQLFVSEIGRMIDKYMGANKVTSPRAKAKFPNGLELNFKWKTLQELHDKLSITATKIQALEDVNLLPWPEELRKLHGARCGDVKILLPRTTASIVKYGQRQNHCVASRANGMRDGRYVIASVWVEGLQRYTMLIKRCETELNQEEGGDVEAGPNNEIYWDLVEFRGFKNSYPEARHAVMVNDIMQKIDIRSSWMTMGNGYGKEKYENWDAAYNKVDNGMPIFPKKPITNFPVPEKEEDADSIKVS